MQEDWTLLFLRMVLTYTYKIRQGVQMSTTNEGKSMGESPLRLCNWSEAWADKKSQALYLVQDSIKGLDDYVMGKQQDFSTVGVKSNR